MKIPLSEIKIKKADLDLFKKHQERLFEIYEDGATSGIQEQYLEMEEEKEYIEDIIKKGGYGFFALYKDILLGFILATPLENDSLLPQSIKKKYPVEKSFYISEIAVHKDYRFQGIGSELMENFLKDVDRKKYEYLFIRAWKNNSVAMNLYQKFGFIPDEIINQEKIKKDRSGTFIIQKQYLVQKL